jgi:outer membrane protein assembly factor BamA
VKEFGRVVNNVPVTVGWSRDNRDSALVPSRGYYTQTNANTVRRRRHAYYKADFKRSITTRSRVASCSA